MHICCTTTFLQCDWTVLKQAISWFIIFFKETFDFQTDLIFLFHMKFNCMSNYFLDIYWELLLNLINSKNETRHNFYYCTFELHKESQGRHWWICLTCEISPKTDLFYPVVAKVRGWERDMSYTGGGKVPQLTNDQRSDAQIYVFALWHPHHRSTSSAFHCTGLPSPAHSNPIPSDDGQRNGNTLICVAYVLTLDGDHVLDTSTISFDLSEEWQERMERARKKRDQCGQWIN